MFERRAHIRIPAGLHGRYQSARKMGAPRLGLTQDISMGGMQMSCMERLEPGERVSVDLPLPREGEVGLAGVVLWSRKSGETPGSCEVGMRWAGLDPSVQVRLSSYINSYTRTRAAAVTAGMAHREPIVSWPRTLALALFLSALILVSVRLGLSWYEISLENRSLRYTLDSQQLIQSRITPE